MIGNWKILLVIACVVLVGGLGCGSEEPVNQQNTWVGEADVGPEDGGSSDGDIAEGDTGDEGDGDDAGGGDDEADAGDGDDEADAGDGDDEADAGDGGDEADAGDEGDSGQCLPPDGGCAVPQGFWREDLCRCVTCENEGQCPAGDVCNEVGECVSDSCESCSEHSDCGEGRFCSFGCCVDCLLSDDCDVGSCVGGRCTSCEDDPSICADNQECVDHQCESTTTPGDCGGVTCEDGEWCNPETEQCEHGCGHCNPDCTCDNGLTCDGFFCTGCTPFGDGCPDGSTCMPMSPSICLPD